MLDIVADRVADRGIGDVLVFDAAGGAGFDRLVAFIVDDVHIASLATIHDVGTGAAIQSIVTVVAGEDVGLLVAIAVDIVAAGKRLRIAFSRLLALRRAEF